MPGETQQIDSTIDIVTPENIAFHYRVAGPFRRLPAFLIDLAIRGIVIFAVSFAASVVFGWFLGGLAMALILIAWFVLEWFYGGLFETFMNGQTPGKWIMGLRVLTVEGRPINGLQAVMRNILRTADIMPFFTCLAGLVAMTLSPRFQRLGDLVCGTIVVIEERHWLTGVARIEDPRAIQLAGYLPTNFEVSRTLAGALAAYIERRRFFSPARRREVAQHLGEPLLKLFELPADTSHDLLLCALYYRAFIADRSDDERRAAEAAVSPFAPTARAPLPQEQIITIRPDPLAGRR